MFGSSTVHSKTAKKLAVTAIEACDFEALLTPNIQATINQGTLSKKIVEAYNSVACANGIPDAGSSQEVMVKFRDILRNETERERSDRQPIVLKSGMA